MKGNLKTLLKEKLKPEEAAYIYKSYDVIGDIAIIRVPEKLLHHSKIVAEALMQQHKHVKAVWRQSSPVSGAFRLRNLEWVAGVKDAETVHKEHGCLFKVNLEKCYFSPRLAFERMRIAGMVGDGEEVLNMFAGVGSYSIVIAKHSRVKNIVSIDLNPDAVAYMRENILLNKLVGKILPIEGDAETVVKEGLTDSVDRVLMPLPEKAHEYLHVALSAVKSSGGWIHFYDFEHASKGEDPVAKAKAKAVEKLQLQNRLFIIPCSRIVRQTGPNWYQVAIDIQIKEHIHS